MHQRCWTLTCLAVVVFLVPRLHLAAAEPAPPKKILAVEGITEYQFDNGCKVLLFPDASRDTVTVNVTVLVGSRHEGYGETGMAHLLEHMVFKGTPTHQNIPKLLQERGANFNGTTWYDRTNYYETLPASDANLEFAIKLEADRLVNSFVKREDLLSEMTVVRNEFESGENSPSAVLQQRMMATAYEWHNYGKSTIGNRSDIERVPIENLQAFYRKFYQPDNVVVTIAGKFDENKALDYLAKYFGTLPRPKRVLDKTWTEEPAQDGERIVTLRRVGDVSLVAVLYHVPAGSHPDFAAIEVLEQMMTDAPSGRLYKALVETKKASRINGDAQPLHDPGVIGFMAEVNKGSSVEEVRDILLDVVEDLANRNITPEEVTRAKQQLLSARERRQNNTTQLAVGLSDWASMGDWRLYFLHRDRLEKVTPEDVQRVAAAYLRKTNRTLGTFLPTAKADRVAIPGRQDLDKMLEKYEGRATVAAGEAFDPTPANVDSRTQRFTLPNGLKVALLPKKSRNEAVLATLTLRYGNAENLKELVTASAFVDDLMLLGTKKLTRQQFQDELSRLKSTLNSGGGGGMLGGGGSAGTMTFAAQAKRETLSATLELLRQVLREPTLPQEEFEVLKRQRLASLQQGRTDPTMLAIRWVQRALSPHGRDDVRYVPTIDEDIERLEALRYEQVRKLYDDFLGGQHGELIIVGDFDPAGVQKFLEATFQDWQAKQPYARIERPAATDVAGQKHQIKTPDKANALYFAGMLLPLRDDDPDYPALIMANYVLGGGSLSSRLGDRIRQKDGLSYGVGSMLSADSFDKRATFGIFAISAPENVGKVDAAVAEELARLLKDGVTADELTKGKQGYLQQQRLGRSSDTGIAGGLAATTQRGRTMTYYADLEKKIEALTPEMVLAALKRHVDPKRLVIGMAGDLEKKVEEKR